MKAFFKKIVVSILTLEARILLRRKKPTIIAVTGSVGKTSTKDAIFAAIKDSVNARKNQKTFNTELGVPLTVLGLQNGWNNPFTWLWNIVEGMLIALFSRDYPSVLVLEAGIDQPGDMKWLASWLKPDVVVLTRFPDVPTHVEYFPSADAVVDEKMKLVQALKSDGVLIYNLDDAIIVSQLEEVRQQTISFARYSSANVVVGKDRVVYDSKIPTGISFEIKTEKSGSSFNVQLDGVLGNQSLYALGAAVAVAEHLGVGTSTAAEGLSKSTTPPSRMRVFPGIKDTILIDDSYNSSPIALEHALDTMAQVRHTGRRIAVLGDMLELGKFSADAHENLGEKVARTCDNLITVGVRARGFATGALRAGMDESNILQYEESDRAGRELQSLLQPGDLVLIKGSQGIRTEKIVKEVMANPQDAERVLVRQDAEWQDIG